MIKFPFLNPVALVASRRRFYAAIACVAFVVVVYELAHLLGIPDFLTRVTLVFALIAAVIISAWRYGLWPSIIVASIANVYIFYAFSGPGRNIVPLENMLRGEWVLALMFFAPAVLIGYLSDRIKFLIQRERSARLQAEEDRLQLTKILEQMPVGVVIAKPPHGELIFSNEHLDHLMGHTVSKHAGLADYPKNVLVDSNGKPLPESKWPITRVIKKQETIVNEEYLYQLDDQNRLVLQIKGTPIINTAGEMTSGVVIIDDVTAEKELVQRKDDFLSMVSHELKTPITSLTMYTQLLMKQLANNKKYDPLTELYKIDEQIRKLNRIINNMLELAIIQQDKQPYQFKLVDINSIITEVVQELKNAHPSREIDSNLQAKGKIKADCDRLSQVITNLVSNALKYSPEGGKVIVTSEHKEDCIQLTIQDFGIGISPRDRKKIFERFYQESQKNGRVYPGLGIGLYFSAEIIKQHKGKIWVESKKGQGSTFYVSLPVNRQE